jgi:hypothetical protein
MPSFSHALCSIANVSPRLQWLQLELVTYHNRARVISSLMGFFWVALQGSQTFAVDDIRHAADAYFDVRVAISNLRMLPPSLCDDER